MHFIIILLGFHLANELFTLCIFNSWFVSIPLLLFPPSPRLTGTRVLLLMQLSALLLFPCAFCSAEKLLLTTPRAQAGDKVWDTTDSSCNPENSDVTRGDSSVWFSFGSSGFNYTLQKDTAFHMCMKCSARPFTRGLELLQGAKHGSGTGTRGKEVRPM